MFEEYLRIKGRPVIGRHMGIPIIVYFLMVYSEYHQLCTALSVLTADLVVVQTCLLLVVDTLDA